MSVLVLFTSYVKSRQWFETSDISLCVITGPPISEGWANQMGRTCFSLIGTGTTRRAPAKFKTIAASLVVVLVAGVFASAGDSPDQKRGKTHKMAAQSLKDLYKTEPTAQGAIQKSAGYAVFNNMGTNLFLLSTARGSGMAVNSKSKQRNLREDDFGWSWSWPGSERLSRHLRVRER